MRTERAAPFAVVLVLMGLTLAAQAAAPDPVPWLPDESYAGGTQADPRLNKPVQCWRAATTLEEVFQGIAEETGVTLGFFPQGDENRRIRVSVFLNPAEPPTLRELMVQLAWVVDCPFAVTGKGNDTTYFLMSTSIAQSAAQDLRTRQQALRRPDAQGQAEQAERPELRAATGAGVRPQDETALPAGFSLSAAAREKLRSTPLPAQPRPACAAWQLQEMVARATGRHVVSDAFAASPVQTRGAAASAEATLEMALSALEAVSVLMYSEPSLPGFRSPPGEGGEAGRFLRFRSSNRDVWRAALLPQACLDWVDLMLAPCLPKPDAHAVSADIALRIDPAEWVRHRAALTDMQATYGWWLLCGDPHRLAEAARQAVISSSFHLVHRRPDLIRLAASLDDGQWARLQGGESVYISAPDQLKLLVEDAPRLSGSRGGAARPAGAVLSLVYSPESEPRAARPERVRRFVRMRVRQLSEAGEVGEDEGSLEFPLAPVEVMIHAEVPVQPGAETR